MISQHKASRTQIILSILLISCFSCIIPTLLPTKNNPTPIPVLSDLSSTQVESPYIQDFEMLDEQNGWALTENQVLRTGDGGMTWYDFTPEVLEAVGNYTTARFFLDTEHAWLVVIDPGDLMLVTLYRTQDGGQTWISSGIPFDGGDMQFLDPQHGTIMSSLGAGAGSNAVAIFQTIDSGSTWEQIYINDPTLPGAADSLPLSGIKSGMTFLDESHGWIGGSIPMQDYIYLYSTADGGITWIEQSLSLPSGYQEAMTSSSAPSFFNSQEGVLPVGMSAPQGFAYVFYTTLDGGETWTPGQPVTMGGQYALASGQDFWVWDGGPQLMTTHDAGLTWNAISTNIDLSDSLKEFQFINSNLGWALSHDTHTLYHTSDGGMTWVALTP